MEKIGRNEPCTCGSGKKYKKCCLEREREASLRKRDEAAAVGKALEWLANRYPDGMRSAVDEDFFGGLKEGEKEKLDGLPPGYHQLLNANLGEWLVTDARIRVDGDVLPVNGLILGPGGPDLTAEGARWLECLGKSPLSLYEVRGVVRGVGMTLADLVRPDETEVWVSEKVATQSLLQWDIVATRIVRENVDPVLSGALYPFERPAGRACLAKIARKVRKGDRNSDSSREMIGEIIRREWLKGLVIIASSSNRGGAVPDEVPTALPGGADEWLNKPLSALDGRTLLESTETAAGRRAVIELLKSWELDLARSAREQGGEPCELGFLWDRLGLNRERA